MKLFLFSLFLLSDSLLWAPMDPNEVRDNLIKNIALLRQQYQSNLSLSATTSHANAKPRQTLSAVQNDGTP